MITPDEVFQPDKNEFTSDEWDMGWLQGELGSRPGRDNDLYLQYVGLIIDIGAESIIMSDGQNIIKVPVRSLDEYHFRYNFKKQKHAGQGNGKSKVGDVLGTDPQGAKQGKDKGGAGEDPGNDYYEADITIDELAEMIFEDLGLPNLDPKKKPELSSDSVEFKDIRKKGISSNIDRKRTLYEALKRNALSGKPGLHGITKEDLRYKTWDMTVKYESSAVVLAMMDTSGSIKVTKLTIG